MRRLDVTFNTGVSLTFELESNYDFNYSLGRDHSFVVIRSEMVDISETRLRTFGVDINNILRTDLANTVNSIKLYSHSKLVFNLEKISVSAVDYSIFSGHQGSQGEVKITEELSFRIPQITSND